MPALRPYQGNISSHLRILGDSDTHLADYCYFPDQTLRVAIALTWMTRRILGDMIQPGSLRLRVSESPVGRKLSLMYHEDRKEVIGVVFDSLNGEIVARSADHPQQDGCYHLGSSRFMASAANSLSLRIASRLSLDSFTKHRTELGVIYDELFPSQAIEAQCPAAFMAI